MVVSLRIHLLLSLRRSHDWRLQICGAQKNGVGATGFSISIGQLQRNWNLEHINYNQ